MSSNIDPTIKSNKSWNLGDRQDDVDGQYWVDGSIGGGAVEFFVSQRKTVALLGDSYVVRDTPTIASGYLGTSQKSIFEWTNICLNKRLKPIYNGYNNADGLSAYDGISGSSVTSFLTRIDAIVAKGADYVWIPGSVNNSDPTNYVPYAVRIMGYTILIKKVLAAGQIPIITTEPPSANLVSSSGGYTAQTRQTDWYKFNNWLRTEGRSMGAIVADYQNTGVDDPISLVGGVLSSYIDAGVHFTWNAAQLIGKAFAASLANRIPAWDIPWQTAYNASATGQRIAAIPNPIMIDSDANGLADRFGAGGTGVVASIERRTDGVQGNWQKLVWTPAAVGGSMFMPSAGGAFNLGDKAIGDTIELFWEVQVDDLNCNMIAGCLLNINFTGAAGVTSRSYQFTDYAGSGVGMVKGFSGIMSTAEVIIPAGTTSFSIQNNWYAAGVGLPCTIRMGRVCIL